MTTTPVIPGFFPDPSICRVGDTYYLATSSFEYLPGVPLLQSTDLVTWTHIGNALTRPEQIAEHDGTGSSGIFAPTLRHHHGRFWLIGTNVNDLTHGMGHFLVSAADPAGPWSDPIQIREAIGIDPDIAWDDEGTAHVTWCSFNPEQRGILSAPVDTESGALLAPARQLWGGVGLASPEGPHLYHHDGWWYLLLAEGGTERGHAVTIARAKTIEGPYEPAPSNPILSHRSLAHPVQNTGHADLVELADGSWAAVHLGVRPRGQTPGFHVNGRETFLVGVDWVDGWPRIDEERFTVPPADRSFRDNFDGHALNPRWVGAGRFPSSFTRRGKDGGLLLSAEDEKGHALLCARVVDDVWSATAQFSAAHGTGRFVLRVDDRHWFGLSYDGSTVEAILTVGPITHTVDRWTVAAGDTPKLRISATPPQLLPYGVSLEPDLIQLAASDSTGEHIFGNFDGRYLSTEVAGGFTGRVFGVEAITGRIYLRTVTYASDNPSEDEGP